MRILKTVNWRKKPSNATQFSEFCDHSLLSAILLSPLDRCSPTAFCFFFYPRFAVGRSFTVDRLLYLYVVQQVQRPSSPFCQFLKWRKRRRLNVFTVIKAIFNEWRTIRKSFGTVVANTSTTTNVRFDWPKIWVDIVNPFWTPLTQIRFVEIFSFWYCANKRRIHNSTEWTSANNRFQFLLLFRCDVNIESAADSDVNDHNTVVEKNSYANFLLDGRWHSTISRDKNVRSPGSFSYFPLLSVLRNKAENKYWVIIHPISQKINLNEL